MYNRQRTLGRLGTAAPPTVQTETVPASVGGINALSSLIGMPATDCIYAFNLMPVEMGQRLRKGYREWAKGVPGDVRSLIPYDNQAGDTSKDRLFAVSESGIYNVTLFNTSAPAQAVAFATGGIDSGYGVHMQFTTDAAQKLVLYADSRNGLHQYDGQAETWSVPAITGPDVTKIAFVMPHKQRTWVIEEGEADAWYSGTIDAASGPFVKFTFGSKFPHGGRLMGLWSWTLDGGDGIDDFLIAVSKGGDVLVYYGNDPSQPDWSLRGSYYIGEVPNSRRIAVDHGGELYLLSSYGVVSVRDLLSGVDVADVKVGPSAKISRFLRAEVIENINSHDWNLQVHSVEGFFQIITPFDVDGLPPKQFTMNLLTTAWGWWRDVPVITAENWQNTYMIGGPDGIVYLYDGALDNTTLEGLEVWTDVLDSAAAEWSQPLALQYACDGTQLAETAYLVVTPAAILDRVYSVEYTITNYVAGQHKIRHGNVTSTTPYRTGNGTFAETLRADGAEALSGAVGDVDFDGTFSNITIKEAGTLGLPIEYGSLTSFQPFGDHGQYMRSAFIRVVGITNGVGAVNIEAIYDYNINAVIAQPPGVSRQGANVWDIGLWDTDLWDFDGTSGSLPLGSAGMGRTMAIGVRGSADSRVTLIGYDVMYNTGGLL